MSDWPEQPVSETLRVKRQSGALSEVDLKRARAQLLVSVVEEVKRHTKVSTRDGRKLSRKLAAYNKKRRTDYLPDKEDDEEDEES